MFVGYTGRLSLGGWTMLSAALDDSTALSAYAVFGGFLGRHLTDAEGNAVLRDW